MVKRSKVILKPAAVGDTVLVHLDKVDRSQVDFPNLIGLILETKNIDSKDFYRIATKDGVLKGWIARDQFDISKQRILTLSSVNTTKEFSKRTANAASSLSGGQGMSFCGCKTDCTSGRCGCFNSKPNSLKCNSKCHPNSIKCKNC